jgi:hypothetical protein
MRIIRNPEIQNIELLIVKAGGTYSYHWALKGYVILREFSPADYGMLKLIYSWPFNNENSYNDNITRTNRIKVAWEGLNLNYASTNTLKC